MLSLLYGFWDYVIVFLIILTVVVFVHELGHFLVARAAGVRIEVFSIGFGPELFGRTDRHGTRWKFSLLPLGGYVRMLGEADDDTPVAEQDRTSALQNKTVGQRAAIVAAGPVANFIFGIIVMAVLFLIYGQPRTAPIVGEVQSGSPAAAAGLMPGDRVVEAAGQTVDRFQDLQRIVRMTVGDPVSLKVVRDGAKLSIRVTPHMVEIRDSLGNVHKTPVLGIVAAQGVTEVVKLGPLAAMRESLAETWSIVTNSLKGIGQIIVGRRDAEELGGPLRIAKGAGQAAQLGIGSVVYYTVLISINLGMINLFPVPLLDGGHLLFYGIEALRGRPLGQRAQEYGFKFGLFLVIALMLLATRNDLVDLKVWEFIKRIVT